MFSRDVPALGPEQRAQQYGASHCFKCGDTESMAEQMVVHAVTWLFLALKTNVKKFHFFNLWKYYYSNQIQIILVIN